MPSGATCDGDEDCLSLELCVTSRCRLVCSDDQSCGPGLTCQRGACLPALDAGTDAGADAGIDAGTDAGTDAAADAGADAGRPDVAVEDAAPATMFAEIALPAGGQVEDVAISRGAPTRLYALTHGRRLFRSSPPGATWSQCGALGGWSSAVAAASADADTIYVGLGVDVLQSEDGCATWRSTGLGLRAWSLLALADGSLLAGTEQGLWRRSADGWTAIDSPAGDRLIEDLTTDAAEQRVFAAAPSGVMVSDDGGLTWEQASTGLTVSDIRRIDVSLRAATDVVATGEGVHYSTDSARHWHASTTLPDGYKYDLAIDPDDPALVVVHLSSGVRVSVDGGDHFLSGDRRDGPWMMAQPTAVTFDPGGGHRLLAASARGLMVASLDTPSAPTWAWGVWNDGMHAWSARGIAVGAAGAIYLATPGGVLASDDAGVSWRQVADSFTPYCALRTAALDLDDPDRLFVGGKGRLYLSVDGAQRFDTYYDISLGWGVTAVWVRGDRVYLGTDQYFARSEDGGLTWDEADLPGADSSVTDLLVIEGSPDEVWVASAVGVFSSTDGGLTLEEQSAGLSDDSLDARSLARLGSGEIMLGTLDGAYRRVVDSWVAAGLAGHEVHDLLVVGASLVAATETGVFRSEDAGVTWNELPGLTTRAPYRLALDGAGHLLVGTSAYGLHRGLDPL